MTACGITRQMASRLRQFSQLQKVNQASILTPNSGNILMMKSFLIKFGQRELEGQPSSGQ